MKIGVPKEIHQGECRVALTPDTVTRLVKLGYEVLVETGAGAKATFSDQNYLDAGATIEASAEALWSSAGLVVKIRAPQELPDGGGHEVDLLPEGGRLISMIWPSINESLVEKLTVKKATVFGLDCVPRISRAQSMDVRSSQAGIMGYRAVLEAAHCYGRYFKGQITAAGKTNPANVLVIGAGVAGLAAIAAARDLGAIVKAFDTRTAVREEIESLGAKYLELEFEESGEGGGGYAKQMSEAFIAAEHALFEEEAKTTDIIITTALIPGRPAPLLVTAKAVEAMKPGSVIVDLAAETGGNCELTETGEVVDHNGVTILGHTDLVSRLPAHASEFFGRNVARLMKLLTSDDGFHIDLDDEIVRGMIVLQEGEMMWPPPKVPEPDRPKPMPAQTEVAEAAAAASGGGLLKPMGALVAAALILLIGLKAPPDFIQHFTVFILACFVGYQVVWNVSHALHTPLMSVTNAISGIIIVGGVLQATVGASNLVLGMSVVAILIASINIFGGFLVTQRMLKMFRADAGSSKGGH